MKNNAIILNRVSTKDQGESGYSLDSQEKLHRSYAKDKELDVLKSFFISETASKHTQRKVFNEMTRYVKKNNVRAIIVEKVDRLTRNPKDAVAINDWLNDDENRTIHFVKESMIIDKNSKSHERLVLNMKVSIAQFYSDNLSEEVRKGQTEKIAQGWLPQQAKLGYQTVELNGKKIHVHDSKKATHVKKTLTEFSRGKHSVQTLAEFAYATGLRSKNGKKVSPSGIHRMLTDVFYMGKFEWNGKEYPGKHKPLISPEIFKRNQDLLNRRHLPKYTRHIYLFKGFSICPSCNRAITWEAHKGRFLYGYCNQYVECEMKGSIKELEIEDKLLSYLDKLIITNKPLLQWVRKAITESHAEEVQYREMSLEQAKDRMKATQKKIDNLVDLIVNEKIDQDRYDRKMLEYTQEKEQAEQDVVDNSQAQTKHAKYSVSFYELTQKARQIYDKTLLEDRRDLLRLLFESIYVNINTKEIVPKLTRPFQIVQELVEYTNKHSSKVQEDVLSDKFKFEKTEKLAKSIQKTFSGFDHSVLRRRWDSNPREPFGSRV